MTIIFKIKNCLDNFCHQNCKPCPINSNRTKAIYMKDFHSNQKTSPISAGFPVAKCYVTFFRKSF